MTIPETIPHVESAIIKALRRESQLDAETLAIRGFSTPTMRRLFGNLCAPPVGTYLECGAFFGASACAAMCGNKHLTSFVVENFSQDFSAEGVREGLLANLEMTRPKTGKLNFIESDCFAMDLALIDKPVDVMFYDALHDEWAQRKAWTHFADKLSDVAIVVCDDFSWVPVKAGCRAGIADVAGKLEIEREWILGDGVPDSKLWHNDVAIFVTSRLH